MTAEKRVVKSRRLGYYRKGEKEKERELEREGGREEMQRGEKEERKYNSCGYVM